MDRRGWQRDAWRAVSEALGGGGVGEVERDLADGRDDGHAPEEDIGGREEREARVVMVVVVPAEEVLQPPSSVELAIQAPGVIRLVLHRLELGLAEGVVVGDAWAAEAA